MLPSHSMAADGMKALLHYTPSSHKKRGNYSTLDRTKIWKAAVIPLCSLPNLNTSAKEGKASIIAYSIPGSCKIQNLKLQKRCRNYNTILRQLDKEEANDQGPLKDFILVKKNNTLVIY